jgi:DNA-binding SARP family transcriptional activator/DNA-binding beta-propeller fold protein YncE
VPLGGAKRRAVLALLLLRANEVVPIDRLIDELWGDSPPESAANMLQGYVSHLRKALEPGRTRGEHELLVSQAPGYVLRIRQNQLDANRFAHLASEGRQLLDDGDPRAAAERLRAALELWRGPALADLAYEAFALPEAERLEELRLATMEDRIDADLALGHHDALVGELREFVDVYPLRERARGQLMAALYRGGRQAEALQVYREGRATLSEQLGIEPGPGLRDLERAILRQDAELGAADPPPHPAAPRLRRRWLLVLGVAVAATAGLSFVLIRGGSTDVQPVVVQPHTVAVIDPARNKVVADIPVGAWPGPLAADQTYVYVGNIGDATYSRILPEQLKVYGTSSFSRATDMIAGGGHIWAADGGAPGHTPLGVSPGTVLDYGPGPTWTTMRVGPNLMGDDEEQTTLASDGDGFSIWAGNKDSKTVRQIDMSLHRTLLTIRGIAPGGLAAVGNSSTGDIVWASDPVHNLVARIDQASKRITDRVKIPGEPTRLAADQRAVWVVTRKSPALWRIDARTNRVVMKIPLTVIPWRVALGSGSVWVTAYRSSNHNGSTRGGAVIRIDPKTNRVAARIPLGDLGPDGILVSHGLVWVAMPPSP